MPIGPNTTYPTLQTVCDLFRSYINDTGSGQDGTTGGQIAYNQAPMILPLLNSAMRWTASKLRLAGDPALILDNYIVTGLPVLWGVNGEGAPDPGTQTYLGATGYWDGRFMWSQFLLPAGILNVERAWERLTNSDLDFIPMMQAPYGLPPVMQVENFGYYEWRQDQLVFPGALTQRDIRMRCTVQLLPFSGLNLNFQYTYIPIYDSERVIAAAMAVDWAGSFSPSMIQFATMRRDEALGDLRSEVVYQGQTKENARQSWDGGDDSGYFEFGSQL